MAELSKAQKVELCQALAQFWETSEIKNYFLEHHKIEITDRQLSYYRHTDPWHSLIKQQREVYLDEVSKVPITHKRVRLEELWGRLRRAKDQDAVRIIKQAQREVEGELGTSERPLVHRFEYPQEVAAGLKAIGSILVRIGLGEDGGGGE